MNREEVSDLQLVHALLFDFVVIMMALKKSGVRHGVGTRIYFDSFDSIIRVSFKVREPE
jgi:hypothetical protein